MYYLDSSAIVKIYVQEQGSDWMKKLRRRSSQGELFVSADKGLNEAARNEGLTVIDPTELE